MKATRRPMPVSAPTLAALIFAAGFASCASVPLRQVEDLVARDALLLESPRDASGMPKALLEATGGKRLVLLGEQHYVLEHREFLVALMGALAPRGFRTLAIEEQGANSWIAEDYCLGRIDALPATTSIVAWRRVLDGIRAMNEGRAEGEKIRCVTIDMNHWSDAFKASLLEMIVASGSEGLRIAASDVLNEKIGGPGYLKAIETLASARIEGLAAIWEKRLAELARLELSSARLRASWSDEAREAIMAEQVLSLASSLPAGEGLAANVGAFHAQYEAFDPGPRVKPMAARLALPASEGGVGRAGMLSVAFMATKGVRKDAIMSAARRSFDLSEARDLSGAIARVAGALDCYLPLAAEEWRSMRVFASWGSSYLTRPGAQYDAYYVYPEIRVDPDATAFER
jgi:hypothetical protein